MKVEVIPSLSYYDAPIYPEDTPEDWGSVKQKPKAVDESQEKKYVRFVYDELRKETLESLEPEKVEPIPVPVKQEALRYAFPFTTLLIGVGLIFVLIIILKFFTA
jgi:hypothetical protein